MTAPARQCSGLVLLLLAWTACAQQEPAPQDSYLFLATKNNRLKSKAAAAEQPTLCSGKKAGDLIEGRYIILFDQSKVTSSSQGIYTVERGLRRQAVAQAAVAQAAASAAGLPTATAAPTTPALTFTVNTALTTDVPTSSGTSSSGSGFNGGFGRRLQQRSTARRRGKPVTPPVLGAVVTVAPGAEGQAVAASIKRVNTVQDVVQSRCMQVLQTSNSFSCLPATMLASSIQTPAASAAWANCLTPNTFLAWWGQRCGSSLSQVQWSGVYAFDKSTGLRLPGCVKQRPAGGGAATQDTQFWLGSCGVAPVAVPALSTMVCRDPYVASTILSPEEQGCLNHNFTEAVQTVLLFHPTPGCGTQQPVNMVYRGQRCTSNDGSSSSELSMAGVLWQSAEPAPGSGMDAAACSLQRKAVVSTENDVFYNMDWFGSCGVPPARVQYAPRSECPATPPPPPPSPSPRPEAEKALDREPVLPGETVTSGMKRIMAVTASANSSTGYETVRVMNPTTVAVLDTGVDCGHRDLNVIFNISFNEVLTTNDPNSDRKACLDIYDHGTNVAGVIGAKNNGYGVLGVLPNAAIASLKILDSRGQGPADNIMKACLWLLQNSLDGVTENPDNATNAEVLGIDVVNMSLGYPDDPYDSFSKALCDTFAALREQGIVVVAAAGNENAPINQAMPGACGGVIAVTAIDQGDDGAMNVTQKPGYFSNFVYLPGPPPPTFNKANLTVAAPGVDVYSTCFQQSAPFCSLTGTSQATPHVSGMVARCFSGGRCKRGGSGDVSTLYAINKWTEYNLEHAETYGYAADPIRAPKVVKYYGYLTNADVW